MSWLVRFVSIFTDQYLARPTFLTIHKQKHLLKVLPLFCGPVSLQNSELIVCLLRDHTRSGRLLGTDQNRNHALRIRSKNLYSTDKDRGILLKGDKRGPEVQRPSKTRLLLLRHGHWINRVAKPINTIIPKTVSAPVRKARQRRSRSSCTE